MILTNPTQAYLPLGLNLVEAATFVGVGKTIFREMVGDGRMPHPRVVGSRRIFDSEELRLAFKNLPIDGEDMSENPWDKEFAS
jgi:excisionase family DNA binding protein